MAKYQRLAESFSKPMDIVVAWMAKKEGGRGLRVKPVVSK
jgi:hypothetical protein